MVMSGICRPSIGINIRQNEIFLVIEDYYFRMKYKKAEVEEAVGHKGIGSLLVLDSGE